MGFIQEIDSPDRVFFKRNRGSTLGLQQGNMYGKKAQK
jgi:hypothetical protein